MDTWGYIHKILGHVVVSKDVVDPERVWSPSSHFFTKDGKNTSGGYNLVMLSPAKEVAYWESRLKVIRENNSKQNLKLVATLLENMENRIKELS